MPMRKWLLVLGLCFWGVLHAQEGYILADSITIEGNRKTKDQVILRELKFKLGDSIAISNLSQILLESEQLIMNTGLFSMARISYKNWEGSTNKVHFLVQVEETWYIYPFPTFELADRNFNVWWVEQNRSLDRINFGGDFTHINFSGRRDKLSIGFKYGYTRNYFLKYRLPFFNRKQTWGLKSEISFSRNRETNYATENNTQLFYRDEETFIYSRFRVTNGFTYRPAHHLIHGFEIEFRQNRVNDIIGKELNPNFFLKGRTLQRFFFS